MESIYELTFPEISFNLSGDTFVQCPFPHHTENGTQFYESTPSMSINVDKGVHHCFGCGAKGNELQFLSQLMGIDLRTATELRELLSRANETVLDWQKTHNTLLQNETYVDMLREKYKFTDAAIKQLQIGLEGPGRGFCYPVFLFGKLMDVISYHPGQTPKYTKRFTSENGFIMPYDDWRYSTKATTICAGQKDLAIALSNGINAIAITGGEGELPKFYYRDFQNRIVNIVYDNDDAGRNGAIKVAMALKPYTKSIKIVDISPICTEKGEDLWDFFVKYHKTKEDLVEIIRNTKEFSEEDYQREKERVYPTITLAEATKQEYLNKTVRSNVQVVATDEEKFLMPSAAHGVKISIPENGTPSANTMKVGEKKYWSFNNDRPKDLLYLVDSNIRESTVLANLKSMMHLNFESNVSIRIDAQEPVYKCMVTDYTEAFTLTETLTEYNAYSIKHKLESGKKYKITYKLVPHPINGNALVMIVFGVEESQDSITTFKVTPEVKQHLQIFQCGSDSLEKTLTKHITKVKGLVSADYDNTLLSLVDFWYHTPLLFNLGSKKGIRAAMDNLIVAESRVGKTTTVQALQRVYGLGSRIPLNGRNATVAGIIGGSQKTAHGYQTRAGVLPRSHKGAVIFEELVKSKEDLLRELTEIRSSGMVIISRVNGTINMPAFVRMLTLTNAKTEGATPKPIASYPNGIAIVVDLVGTAEDIARYDIIGVLPGRGAHEIDPFFQPEEPYSEAAYRARIRWVWSRTAEQVIITKEIYQYAVETANRINKDFDSYIKIFGTEAYLKILRLSIAVAGYTVSTDANFETIVVTKEHIDYAAKYMLALYDNETFRLRQYVAAEQRFRETDAEAIKALQLLWEENAALLLHLENYSTTSVRTLQSVCNMENSTFNTIVSRLVANQFARFDGNDLVPTERFRKTMRQINKLSKDRVIRI